MEVVAVGEALAGPAGAVSDCVVVGAVGVEVADSGGSTVGVFKMVVDVRADGGGAAAGVDAGGVAGLDFAALGGGGSAPGDPIADRLAGVGVVDGIAPLAAGLGFGDLAGEVGDHRPIAGQLARVLVEPGQCF